MIVGIESSCQPDLLKIGGAGNTLRASLSTSVRIGEHGQKEQDEQSNGCDHHENFEQRQTALTVRSGLHTQITKQSKCRAWLRIRKKIFIFRESAAHAMAVTVTLV